MNSKKAIKHSNPATRRRMPTTMASRFARGLSAAMSSWATMVLEACPAPAGGGLEARPPPAGGPIDLVPAKLL